MQNSLKSWQVILIAVLGFLVYKFLVPYAVGYAPVVIDLSEFWYGIFGRNSWSAISYMQFCHSVGLLIASIPVAIFLIVFRPQSAIYIGALIGLFLSVETLWHLFMNSSGVPSSFPTVISNIIDIIKFLVFLPLLVWFGLRMMRRSAHKIT